MNSQNIQNCSHQYRHNDSYLCWHSCSLIHRSALISAVFAAVRHLLKQQKLYNANQQIFTLLSFYDQNGNRWQISIILISMLTFVYIEFDGEQSTHNKWTDVDIICCNINVNFCVRVHFIIRKFLSQMYFWSYVWILSSICVLRSDV